MPENTKSMVVVWQITVYDTTNIARKHHWTTADTDARLIVVRHICSVAFKFSVVVDPNLLRQGLLPAPSCTDTIFWSFCEVHHQIIHHTAAPTGSNYVDLTGKLQKLKIGPSQPSHREKPFHATIYSGVKLILLHGLSVLNKQVPVQGRLHMP
mgnify:CR=1 FL=1